MKMGVLKNIAMNLPEVARPTQKRLSFNEKMKWTAIVLVLFFLLGMIPLYGLGENALQTFEFLSVILAAEFGSIISLGIGPIVTASIVLQLLNGSGIVSFDLTTHEGKKNFQATQKLLAIFFIVAEAMIYVFMGGLAPAQGISPWLLIFQLFLGGLLILFMDEVVSKWGFGQGISLFIAAGVSKQVVVRLLSPLTQQGTLWFGSGQAPVGALPAIFHFLPIGGFQDVMFNLLAVIATIVVFVIAVYTQAMKVEIPLSFGRIRGHGVRWPLAFVYTSNIPVILVAALLANIQLWARLLQNAGHPLLGEFVGNNPSSGLVLWLSRQNLVGEFIRGNLQLADIMHALTYLSVMVIGAVIFSLFWVKTAGMDARSQAKQMMSSGLQVPGFRRDERVLESLLNRYITPLTVMGGATIGFLAGIADLSGALGSGTGILLTVMIIYRLYEEIAQQHAMDMYPMLRRFME
jgi:preprotein translocase subunit SecY